MIMEILLNILNTVVEEVISLIEFAKGVLMYLIIQLKTKFQLVTMNDES